MIMTSHRLHKAGAIAMGEKTGVTDQVVARSLCFILVAPLVNHFITFNSRRRKTRTKEGSALGRLLFCIADFSVQIFAV